MKTFTCNGSMIITIPVGNLKDAGDGVMMPDKFHCVFRDSYKVFVIKGKPRPVGAAQAIAGVFLCVLGLVLRNTATAKATASWSMVYTMPSVLFVVAGMLSYAAGKYPNIHVAKVSFSLNIISFFWSIVALILCGIVFNQFNEFKLWKGINVLVISLLVVENLLALFLIFWLSKAVCRDHFNMLPTILLKQEH